MSGTGTKSEKYPDPELYTGERGDKLNQFIFGLESKLKLNANCYSTPESHLRALQDRGASAEDKRD